MKTKRVFCVCLFMCVLFITVSGNAGEQENTADRKELLAGVPDPAAAYAAKLEYKYEIREGEDGVVIFHDGAECKGWDFFRGKAGQKWSHCEQRGGKIENRIENMGTWTAEYAVCVFSNGSECNEADYIDGKSGPGVYKKWSLNAKKCIKFDDPSPICK